MSWSGTRDRRGRAERGATGLLGRDAELQAIESTLERTSEGAGQALLLEGHAGIGKTRLHEAALDSARERGFRLLRAAGAELERNIAFGIAGQLLTAHLNDLSERRRRAVRQALPERVESLVGGDSHSDEDPSGANQGGYLPLLHAVLTVLATESRAALIALVALLWCYTSSLELVPS